MKRNICIALACMFLTQVHALGADAIKDTLGVDRALSATPASLLSGRVSGLRVSSYDGSLNGAPDVKIRGVNTFRGDSQPLWIVDGIMLNGSSDQLSFLDIANIESIQVLKDMSATAIYGARGANGVVIVNTGRKLDEGMSIQFDSNFGVNDSYQKSEFFKHGFSHDHALRYTSVKGNSNLTTTAFYRSLSGVAPEDAAYSGGMTISYDTQASPVVWFGMNAVLSCGKTSTSSYNAQYGDPSLMMAIRVPSRFPGDTPDGWQNDFDNDSMTYRALSSTYLTLNFTPSLSLKTTAGIDYQNRTGYMWMGNGTSAGLEANGISTIVGSSLVRYNAGTELMWHRFFGSHHVHLAGGAEVSGDMDKYNTMTGSDFFTHELRAKGLSIHASKSAIDKHDYNYFSAAAFVKGDYSFNGYAGTSFVFRPDWTPRYSGARPQLYGSADAFLDFKKMILSKSEIVSTLKISGGYGVSGLESRVPVTEYMAVDPEVAPFFEAMNSLRSEEWNIGADLGFLSDRISLSAKYFRKRTRDSFEAWSFGKKGKDYLWSPAPREEAMDFSSVLFSEGVETDVYADIVKAGAFVWSVNANCTYNTNMAVEVSKEDRLATSVGGGLVANANIVNNQVGSFFGYINEGDGILKDKTGDGRITEADMVMLGNPFPKVYGGFGTTFKAYGASLDIQADGAVCFDIVNLPALFHYESAPDRLMDTYVERGDYIRLSQVSVSYELKFRKVVKSLIVSLSGKNLLTLSKYSGWSPMVNSYGTCASTSGLDYGSYPAYRSFVAGVRINF